MKKVSVRDGGRFGDSEDVRRPVHGITEGPENDSCQGRPSGHLRSTSDGARGSGTGQGDPGGSPDLFSSCNAIGHDQGRKGRGKSSVGPAPWSHTCGEEVEEAEEDGGGDGEGSVEGGARPSDIAHGHSAAKEQRARQDSKGIKRVSVEDKVVVWGDSQGEDALAAPLDPQDGGLSAQEAKGSRSASQPRGTKLSGGVFKVGVLGERSGSAGALMRVETKSSAQGSRTSRSWWRGSQPQRRSASVSVSADPSQSEHKKRVSRLASKTRQSARRTSMMLQGPQEMIYFKDYEEVRGACF